MKTSSWSPLFHHGNGVVYTFDAISGSHLQKFTNTDTPQHHWFGRSDAMIIHSKKNVAIIGHGYETELVCSLYVFDLSTGAQIQKITPAVSAGLMHFGASLFVYGDYLPIGAPGVDIGSGGVYMFDVNANWNEVAFFGPSDRKNTVTTLG